LQLLIEAARLGAKVRVLLDGLFDEAEALRSNQVTVKYLEAVASVEGIDIMGRRATRRVAVSLPIAPTIEHLYLSCLMYS
jgi:hypothetical protein